MFLANKGSNSNQGGATMFGARRRRTHGVFGCVGTDSRAPTGWGVPRARPSNSRNPIKSLALGKLQPDNAIPGFVRLFRRLREDHVRERRSVDVDVDAWQAFSLPSASTDVDVSGRETPDEACRACWRGRLQGSAQVAPQRQNLNGLSGQASDSWQLPIGCQG